jgi:protein-S-isoprenylcysteine O-methyltransferase Ste14
MVKETVYVGLSIVAFSLAHSITASLHFKNKIKKLIGERIYEGWFRVSYNAVSLITLAPILYFLRQPSPMLWSVEGIVATSFNIFQITGVIGILISLWQIDWLSFMGIRQLMEYVTNQSVSDRKEALVTTGLYKLTRHPLYFFSLVYIWFVPSMSASWLFFSIGATLYFLIGSYFEEKKMIKMYGHQYKTYRQEVAWLIPFIKLSKPTVS